MWEMWREKKVLQYFRDDITAYLWSIQQINVLSPLAFFDGCFSTKWPKWIQIVGKFTLLAGVDHSVIHPFSFDLCQMDDEKRENLMDAGQADDE